MVRGRADRAAPSQPRGGLPARAILASDPTGIAKLIDELKEVRIVEFSIVRLLAIAHTGDLDVSNRFCVGLQLDGEIAAKSGSVATAYKAS